MHAERLAPARPRSVIPGDRSVMAAPGDTIVVADRSIQGLAFERTFSFHEPLLSRISHGVLLDTQLGVAAGLLSVGRRAAPAGIAVVRYDDAIPAAVDLPTEGQSVRRQLVVKGWCQLRGGESVAPVDFQVDGVSLPVLRLERFARPDVVAVIPEIGNPSQLGYAAVLDSRSVERGTHDLKVTFRAGDGRSRIYPPVRFDWTP
jgi:hypothetical protein